MAGQYNFPPPPPPPGPHPPNHHQPHQPYGYAQQQPPPHYQQPHRGGGNMRGGRGGGHGGRGDYHAPYNPQQPQIGYDPQNPHGPPQGQGPPVAYNSPHGQQNPAAYIGPQAPGPQAQPGGYMGGPQWQQNHQHHGPPHHGPVQHNPQPPISHTPQPALLSAQNYHPNYAPQAYQPQQSPQPQYGAQQPPHFQGPHTPSYGHSVPPHQSPTGPPQWSGPPQQTRPPFNNNRGRGGFSSARGGHEAPLMGPPIRMGFDHSRGGHAQAGNAFPNQYANHHSPPPFSQPSYQAYPQPEFSHGGQRPSFDHHPHGNPQRGRGGGGGHNSNFKNRDRGNSNHQHRSGRNDHRQHNGNGAASEHPHRPAGADVNGKKNKKKRRTNTLGLTPNGVDHEDSDDEIEDGDEEARLVTLLGPDTPQMPPDLEAWLAERRARFPTKARREAAAEELRQRREQNRNARKHSKEAIIKVEESETKLEKQQRRAEKLRLELEKAERRIQQEMSSGKRKRENGDDGDEDRGELSDDSNGSSGSDSDNKPEAYSSRSQGPLRMQPPPKAQLQRHCKYFSTGGTCGKKGKCRFVHDQEVRNQALRDKEANGGKMTLAQRLILNDTAKDDLTILKSIKYLKEKGLMPDQLNGDAAKYDDDSREENGYTENLNYGDS